MLANLLLISPERCSGSILQPAARSHSGFALGFLHCCSPRAFREVDLVGMGISSLAPLLGDDESPAPCLLAVCVQLHCCIPPTLRMAQAEKQRYIENTNSTFPLRTGKFPRCLS